MPDRKQNSSHAWAMSLILHVTLLLAICFFWTHESSRGIDKSETEKPVGIVIASTTSDSNATEYFDNSTYSDESNLTEATATEKETFTFKQSLPLPDIDLRGLDSPASNAPIMPAGNALDSGTLADGLPAAGPSAEQITREQSKLPSNVSRGPVGEVSIFGGQAAAGHDFVFVIDRSKSMGGQGLNALVAAQQQITQSLVGLKENHRFNIIAYHHRPTYFQAGNDMATSNQSNIKKVNDFFNGLAAFGGTDHEMGIIAALRYKPDVIFFLTDGGDPYLNQAQISDLRKYCGGRTSVYSVQFGFGALPEQQNFMRRLAKDTGGKFQYVDMRKR